MSDILASQTIDNRMIAAMRLVLASSALVIIYFDPSEPDRLVPLTYAALLLYSLYSILLYVGAVYHHPLVHRISGWAHWTDLGWYTLIIALSSGTSSLFFYFYFFSILVASFRVGFRSGLGVTIISVLLFTIIGYVAALHGSEFEMNRFLLRPIYLMVLGYMMSYWGGFEILLKRRLALLKEVTTLSNPRFGVDRTMGSIIERLRAFYDADSCVFITKYFDTSDYSLRRVDRRDPEAGMQKERIDPKLARQMLALPCEYAVIYSGHNKRWPPVGSNYYAYDLEKNERTSKGEEVSKKIAGLLNAGSFVTIPFRYSTEGIARLYLTAQRRRAFDHSDIDFLLQVMKHVMPVIDNIRLVDRLASDAAEAERQRIARDIHDSIIQPYIGLQIGLSAMNKKLASGHDVSMDVMRLIEMTDDSIAELRRYVGGLKGAGEREGSLLPSVRRFASKFREATGIMVEVKAESDIRVNDRLAAEAFQMVAEALSNIRRHTQAAHATVGLASCGDRLVLRIENETPRGQDGCNFIPRSITDRAAALGGRTQVERSAGGGTAVVVEIPL